MCFQTSQHPFFRNGQNKPNQIRLRVQVMHVLLNFVSEVSEELVYDLTEMLLLKQRWHLQSSCGCPNLSLQFKGNVCVLTMYRKVWLYYTIWSLTEVSLAHGPSWLSVRAFVVIYNLSSDLEVVLTTCTRLQKICILLDQWEKRVNINSMKAVNPYPAPSPTPPPPPPPI